MHDVIQCRKCNTDIFSDEFRGQGRCANCYQRARYWVKRRGFTWEQAFALPAPSSKASTCKYPGCTKENHARGYCKSHYKREFRSGNIPVIQPHFKCRKKPPV